MIITTKKTLKNFKIYIDNLVHLIIPIDELSGVQSWLDGDSIYTYHICYYLKNNKIVCEYEDRKLWEEILKQIDEKL